MCLTAYVLRLAQIGRERCIAAYRLPQHVLIRP